MKVRSFGRPVGPQWGGFALRSAKTCVLLAIMMVAGTFVVGCTPRPEPAVAPAVVRAAHAVAPACRAALNVRVQPEGGEATTLTLHVWADHDGALRLKVAKLDVDVLDLLIAADGTYLAWAPRSHEQATGRISDADTPALLDRLTLVASELTHGPLPDGIATTAKDGQLWWIQDGATVSLTANLDGQAIAKRIAHPTLGVLDITYGAYQDFEGLRRAKRLHVIGLGLEATAVVRQLDPVPAISPAGMRVEPAADAPVIPIAVLLEHLA